MRIRREFIQPQENRPFLFGIGAALIILLAASLASAASTMLDYEKRLLRAAQEIERIKTDGSYEKDGLACVRELLPAEEIVTFDGAPVTVNNSWLHALLEMYEKESEPEKRLALLNEAGGRLLTLDEHLRDAEAVSGEVAGAEDSREKIREILSRSEFRERGDDPFTAYIKDIRNRILKMISEFFRRLFQIIFGSKGASSVISKFIIVGMIAAAAYLVYLLARRVSWRRKGSKKRIVMGEEIEASMTAEGLADAALAAAKAGDFRTGVRNLYISLLYELAEQGIIELEPETTNHEYLTKVSARAPLAAPMRYLTDRFDYFWYGMFASTEQDFAAFHERYKEAIGQARAASPSAAGA